MSRSSFALLAVVAAVWAPACVVDRHADPDPSIVEPRTCTVDVVVTSDSAPTSVPLGLDASGQVVCLHLDATKVGAAHFVASTALYAGDSSGVIVVLQDPDRGMLQDGWDVTPEISDASDDDHTYANVEWNAPGHELTEAILWLRAPQHPIATTLQLSLVSP
ncbi:MAG TPA: hypothetical protein VH143_20800 [Kofleriaceae bacterium]|jgi:hypothetical protein|nr:hypothetical protein [Kofleriaceae bacterium]